MPQNKKQHEEQVLLLNEPTRSVKLSLQFPRLSVLCARSSSGMQKVGRFVTFYTFRQLLRSGDAAALQNVGRYHEKEREYRFMPMRAVGASFGVTLLLLFMATSEYYATPYIDAEIKMQNFTEHEASVTPGMTLLTYETRSTDILETMADFLTGVFTDDNFVAGSDDLRAVAASDDYVGLNHYGDNAPDTEDIDWWDDDADSATLYNWRYRKCFTVDNTATDTEDLLEHQIYLSVDTETLVSAGKMQADGGDIRFTTETGAELPYYIADDMNTDGTRIWVQIDDINDGEEEEICMYYGHHAGTVATNESREDVFTYTNDTPIYHVVADTAEGGRTNFASYSDDNDITIAAYDDELDEYDADTFPTAASSLLVTSTIGTTDPINGSYHTDGTDNLVPVSAAGTEFVYAISRYTSAFDIVSPWCAAELTFENGSGNSIFDTDTSTTSPFSVPAGGSFTVTTNDTTANGIPNNDIVIIEEVGNDCPVLITHHDVSGGDSFPMLPATNEWYGIGSSSMEIGVMEDNTSITIYRSSGVTTGPTVYNRGDRFSINDAGSQGSEDAKRVVADKKIGVHSNADADGGEAETAFPVSELGYKYYIADVTQYIAIATTAGVTTTVDLFHDGTSCGVGTPDDTATVSPTGDNPGKVYFGLTSNGDHIPAGACVVADQPIYAYNEYNAADDEHNLWNEKQNRQFISPAPTYAVGAEEIGEWEIDGTNTWIRRVPITVTNNTATALTEYQVLVDLGDDVTTLFGETQVDGGDIRVAGALGDGSDNTPYVLENWNDATQSGEVWLQVPSLPASGASTVYIYYSPVGEDITSFSPLLWVDAADTSTITETAGALTTLDDKSGNANHFSAPAGKEPTVATDGIKQVITFDGTDDEIQDADGVYVNGTTYTDLTYFLVYKDLTLGVNDAVFAFDASGGQVTALLAPWGTLSYWRPSGVWTSDTYGGDTTDYHVIRLENETTATDQKSMFRDNVLVGTTAGGGETVTGDGSISFIGDWITGDLYNKHMQFAEMIAIPSALTVAEEASIEQYLTEKWITRPSTTLATTGSRAAVFSTTTPKDNYYVVDSLGAATGSVEVISFADGATITFAGDSEVLNEGEMVSVPFGSGVEQESIYEVRGPLHINYDNDATDSAIPISYAGKEFVTRVGRSGDIFSLKAPFVDASVQIQESSTSGWTTLSTVTVTAGSVVTVSEDIVNNRAFRILSDEPVLAFHRNETSDSKILYPVDEALDPDSGMYEIWGVGANSLMLASNGPANVTIYRSDNSSNTITLNAANNFVYTEGGGGGGAQGEARGYHIVSDAPIGATSYADSDGGETATFVSKKEFSDEYILASPAQYMAVVAADPTVTCRVYDETGAEVITGPATLDNVPPQTTGANAMPFPNKLHIGGNDTSDGAFFQAGYRMSCDEAVYAYFEHHIDGAVTDETSWLTWAQARKKNYVEPTVEDVDATDEEGLYYESGFDSAGAGALPEASAEYIFGTTSLVNGEHTYWRDLSWEQVIVDRAGENTVTQVLIETASAAPSPTCAVATYSTFSTLENVTTVGSSSNALTYALETTEDREGTIPLSDSDKSCLKVRITIQTGDEAFSPRVNNVSLGYYVPTELEGQLDNPVITVTGATSGASEEYRLMKAVTTDVGFLGSNGFLSYYDVSTPAVFTAAEFDIYEESAGTQHAQFNFPPFPGVTPVSSATTAPFDAANNMLIYFSHERAAGALETIDMSLDVDILGADGPLTSRDFQVEVTGI